jgi:hypothetical protein
LLKAAREFDGKSGTKIQRGDAANGKHDQRHDDVFGNGVLEILRGNVEQAEELKDGRSQKVINPVS